ncbi:hypothetical protein BC835DRAFT_1423074 [Cytidiella melzeri]|nr:hypothetical protein BC835DRAFT_1423074 [Cytidiella melzeri]
MSLMFRAIASLDVIFSVFAISAEALPMTAVVMDVYPAHATPTPVVALPARDKLEARATNNLPPI